MLVFSLHSLGVPGLATCQSGAALDSQLNCVHFQPPIDLTFSILHRTDNNDLKIIIDEIRVNR